MKIYCSDIFFSHGIKSIVGEINTLISNDNPRKINHLDSLTIYVYLHANLLQLQRHFDKYRIDKNTIILCSDNGVRVSSSVHQNVTILSNSISKNELKDCIVKIISTLPCKDRNTESPMIFFSSSDLQFIKYFMMGNSVSTIAEKLNTPLRTASSHKIKIMKKLGVKNTSEFIVKLFILNRLGQLNS